MKYTHKQTAYALLRITIGFNFLGHGLSRLPKIPMFRDWVLKQFEGSILPHWSVYAWGTMLPILEFLTGLLLIVGLFTYRASLAGAGIIAILILGSCLIQNWEWAEVQMIYALFFFFVITHVDQNAYALDTFFKKKKEW